MPKDKIFSKRRHLVKDFDFGKKTAAVFDDMLARSVPFYAEMQRMLGEIVTDFAQEGSNLYDLGCSTCTTLLTLDPLLPAGVRFVGVDSSADMLRLAREKLVKAKVKREYELLRADLNQGVEVENASVVIMSLTLQFVRPLHRQQIIRSIAQGTNAGGCLLVIEKVLSRDSDLNRYFIKYYYDFKRRNGYTDMEIAQKREALENVLIPYRLEENRELFLKSGFSQCDVFFKWYNFCGMIALK